MNFEKSKIKILVDAHIFDHSFQGTATYIHGLYSELVKFEDVQITLCSHDTSKLVKLFSHPRFDFIELKSSSRLKRLFVEYPRIIKAGNYDYAHFQYIVPFIKNCKFITTIHDLLFLEFKNYFPWSYRVSRKILFQYSAKQSDIVLSVSEYSKADIAKRFKINPDLIYVTPNAVQDKIKSNINIAQKYGISKYILFVSRFEPRKNHLGLIKAYLSEKLYLQGYSLVFIGSKKENIELEAFNEVKELINDSAREYIHFFEGLTYSELNAFYQQASCFAFPSFAEGFGIPPIEAAVNECKVISSHLTAMSDFTFFKYLFDPSDQREFQTKLIEVLKDENYPFSQIKNEVLAKYNWKSIAKNFREILMKEYSL